MHNITIFIPKLVIFCKHVLCEYVYDNMLSYLLLCFSVKKNTFLKIPVLKQPVQNPFTDVLFKFSGFLDYYLLSTDNRINADIFTVSKFCFIKSGVLPIINAVNTVRTIRKALLKTILYRPLSVGQIP